MYLTNNVTFKFNGKDYFAKLMQRYRLFLTFQKDRDSFAKEVKSQGPKCLFTHDSGLI